MQRSLIGIYKITCVNNSKVYVGSSSNIKTRWYRHISNLKYNKSNPNLQNSYNKYGKDSLKFEVLEECDVKDLIKKETFWAEKYIKEGVEIFNVGEFIESPTRGTNLSEAHKSLLRERFSGEKNPSYKKMWVHNDYEEKYIKESELDLYQKNGYKKGLTLSHRLNISMRQKEIGRKMTEENKRKIIEIAKRPKSEKQKMKLSKIRKELCGIKILCIETGEIFDSYTDAANKFNTSYQAIRQSIMRGGSCSKHHFKKI